MAITKSYKRRRATIINRILREEINKLQIIQDMPQITKWISKNIYDLFKCPDKFIYGKNRVMKICGHELWHCELIEKHGTPDCVPRYRYILVAFPVECRRIPSYLDSFAFQCPVRVSGTDDMALLMLGRYVKTGPIALI